MAQNRPLTVQVPSRQPLPAGGDSLDVVLRNASARIAAIGRRAPQALHAVRQDGATVVELYRYRLISPGSSD